VPLAPHGRGGLEHAASEVDVFRHAPRQTAWTTPAVSRARPSGRSATSIPSSSEITRAACTAAARAVETASAAKRAGFSMRTSKRACGALASDTATAGLSAHRRLSRDWQLLASVHAGISRVAHSGRAMVHDIAMLWTSSFEVGLLSEVVGDARDRLAVRLSPPRLVATGDARRHRVSGRTPDGASRSGRPPWTLICRAAGLTSVSILRRRVYGRTLGHNRQRGQDQRGCCEGEERGVHGDLRGAAASARHYLDPSPAMPAGDRSSHDTPLQALRGLARQPPTGRRSAPPPEVRITDSGGTHRGYPPQNHNWSGPITA